jgi:hypothetical protein
MRTVFLLILFITSVAHADRFNSVKSNSTYVSFDSSVAARTTVLEEMFGSEATPFDNNGLNWPPLPRFWGMDSEEIYIESRVGAGFDVGIKANFNFNYKYKVATTFHYLGSVKILRDKIDSTVGVRTLRPEEIQKVLLFDPQNHQHYFHISEKDPIVGMCQYEISLSQGKSVEGGISWVLEGMTSTSKVKSTSISVFSRLFNIKPRGEYDEYSTKWYIEKECGERFNNVIKPYVEEAFGYKAIEFVTYNHPQNECEQGSQNTINGDASCFDFHQSFGLFVRNSTVARCVQQKNGASQCRLRAKQAGSCPMYRARDGSYTEKFQSLYSDVTMAGVGMTCDQGLECTMDRKPLGIGQLVIWPGTASCKKK